MMKIWDASHPPEPLVLKSSSFSKNGVSSYCVACSPDGRRIAAGYADNAVRVWDTATGQVRAHAHGPRQARGQCGVQPVRRDHRLGQPGQHGAALGCRHRLRSASAWRSTQVPVNSARFSPDGRRLVSASDDGTLKVWDPATGQCVLSIPSQTGAVHGAKYSPDGRSIASAGFDGRIRLWNAETGQLLATIDGPC